MVSEGQGHHSCKGWVRCWVSNLSCSSPYLDLHMLSKRQFERKLLGKGVRVGRHGPTC
jgi:hypothetical protein